MPEQRQRQGSGGVTGIVINGRFLMQQVTGVQRVARELTRALDRLAARPGCDLSLTLVCEPRAPAADLGLTATRIVRAGGASGHLWEQAVLPRHVGDALLLCLGNTAPIASILAGKPVALMVHDLSYRLFPEAYRTAYRVLHSAMMPTLLRRADPIFAVSDAEKIMLSALFPQARSRMVVATNGGWHDDLVAPTEITPERLGGYVLSVGSLSERKNFSGLIRLAIELAREQGRRTIFVGASGPFLRTDQTGIPEDLRHLIEFRGQLNDGPALAALYANASCLVFPSFYEACPMPPVEAMAFGCPVIASDIAANRERCGDAAEYCNPHDVAAIKQAIARVTGDIDHARALAANGYAVARRTSWDAQAETIVRSCRDRLADGG